MRESCTSGSVRGAHGETRVPTATPPIAAVHKSASVQVFGRRQRRAIHALRRPEFEKRQGTKSREVRSVGRARKVGSCPRVPLAYRNGMYTAMVLGAEATRNVLALCRPSPIT